MTTQAPDGLEALTEKERETLRLIVRGHDAKSIARAFDLSIHTINERLRAARRKLAVSSSREAARMLLAAEGGSGATAPKLSGDIGFGDVPTRHDGDQAAAPIPGAGRRSRHPMILTGAVIMTFALALLALTATPQPVPGTAHDVAPPPAAVDAEVVETARRWLALLDQGRWAETYATTSTAFRDLNTLQAWRAASEVARAPLGEATSREVLSQEFLPAPPQGYEVVKFRTRFARNAAAVETVTLDRENGAWRVAGVTIE